MVKKLIKSVRIMNPFGNPEFIENGYVSITDNRIEKLETKLPDEKKFDTIIDMSGKTILPGMINAHHHLYSSLALGMPAPTKPPANFIEILQNIWWKLDSSLDENLVKTSFEVGLLESLKSGVSTIFDHHSSPNFTNNSLEILVKISEKLGINISPSFEITDRNGYDFFKLGLLENLKAIQKHKNTSHVFPLIGLHASFTLSDKSLEKISETILEFENCGLHIHVSEDKADEEDARKRGYISVIQRLNSFGLLNKRSIIAHGIHILPRDTEILLESGVNLIHNPTSNANNKVGSLKSETIEKLNAGLGTDGMQPNMLSEAKEGGFIRSSQKDRNIDYLRLLFENNSMISSKLSNLKIGKIQPGFQADLVFYNYCPRTEINKTNFSAHILYGLAKPTDVMTQGEFRIRDGKCLEVDEFEILKKATQQSKLLWNKMSGK